MPSWLVDDPSTLFVVLGVVALGLAAAWWATRDRRFGYAGAGVAALFLVVLLLSKFVDTDAKRIQRTLDAMVAGVEARSADRIFEHLSDSFRRGNVDKTMFRGVVEGYLRNGKVTGMQFWDFEAVDVSRAKRSATVSFRVKGRGSAVFGYEYFNCRAIFVLDPDGQWRIQTFDLFAPHIDPNSNEALPLPF